jgi:hypothetical protein
MTTMRPEEPKPSERSEFLDALRKGIFIGLGLLVLVLPPMKYMEARKQAQQPPVAQAPAPRQAPQVPPAIQPQPVPQAPPVPEAPPRLAEFGEVQPSQDVKHVANWAVYTRDNGSRHIVIVDKIFAKVYVFNPTGKLIETTPALLGEAVGDHTVPGIADKPLSQIKKHEKTTPAGRFIAEPGSNLSGEDVVWVDYDAAVSMHRIRAHLTPKERRAERMATPTHKDNRISNGCINLPIAFYEKVLSPAVNKTGAVIYVLPEVRDVQEVFGSWDVTSPLQLAEYQRRKAAQQVAGKVPEAPRQERQAVANRGERI